MIAQFLWRSVFFPEDLKNLVQILVVAASDEWQPGDQRIYLLHDLNPLLLWRLSGSNRLALVLETLATVEELPMPNPSADPLKPDPTTEEPSPLHHHPFTDGCFNIG